MAVRSKIIPNLYRDSVALMRLSADLSGMPGIGLASAVMATDANLALLREAGLVEEPPDAGANDLLVVIEGEGEEALNEALAEAQAALARPRATGAGDDADRPVAPRSIAMAVAERPEANLALVSTPGAYAASEALKALRLGLNVMLFSDNVSVADEAMLKGCARDRGLLLMGPDCGTAIIDGVPLGFANAVRRGNIGVVAASGTGLQQVTCLIDRAGGGISQAIGTGGRDLSDAIGGVTMLHGLAALAADADTTVIVLVSKPPAPEVAERVLREAAGAGKPVVVTFLGADAADIERHGVHAARTLADAAASAIALSGGAPPAPPVAVDRGPEAARLAARLAPGQRYVRGLFSGGTFCYEALLLLGEALGPVWSNTPIDPGFRLDDPWRSRGHSAVDLGDDVFTRARPHPMIDQRLRNARIVAEAGDPETAVIVLDIVLGYGAHPDPAPEIAAAIGEAKTAAAGRQVVFVGSVCGTAGDPQGLDRQQACLREAGVVLCESNEPAVRLAAAIVAAAEGRRDE